MLAIPAPWSRYPLAENTLLIVPEDLTCVPRDVTSLIADLHAQGFIGEALAGALGTDRYAIGDAYPRLLSFMGCSPYFKTAPATPGDLDYCHLELRGPWPQPRLLGRLDDAAPRCPACRKPDRQWRADGHQPLPDQPWTCPHCRATANWGGLDWRQRAGFTRFALVLHHVYEGEAVPGPALLKTLAAHSDGPWTWFYA